MIRIGEYALKASDECWMFGKVRTWTDKKTGEVMEKIHNPSYPVSIERALELFARHSLLDTDPQSFDELKAALERVRAQLEIVQKAVSGRPEGTRRVGEVQPDILSDSERHTPRED